MYVKLILLSSSLALIIASFSSQAGERRRPLPRNDVGVGVLVAPVTEHWRSNYAPDSYRLRGYNGEIEKGVICQTGDTTTYATYGTDCSEGQRDDSRTLSTRPQP